MTTSHTLLLLLGFEAQIPLDERDEIRAVIKTLPEHSVVGQWAVGGASEKRPKGLKNSLWCRKGWHGWRGQPNPHATLILEWVDQAGDLVETVGIAHLHENGRESVKEYRTGVLWSGILGSSLWNRQDGLTVKPFFELTLAPPIADPPPAPVPAPAPAPARAPARAPPVVLPWGTDPRLLRQWIPPPADLPMYPTPPWLWPIFHPPGFVPPPPPGWSEAYADLGKGLGFRGWWEWWGRKKKKMRMETRTRERERMKMRMTAKTA
ncbi:hypothetical protein P280DRAFT_481613 [Massarina eburnea CBS 473.64]|uniref:Uncharacterized protein n=1 Tax=Massarina eburnea CBS 473.64 TaxID=1395130 RepID=A0A6A6RVR2_9PLEO|nr:hypothetical protein P280DRAFT_481613 [Massarina eburnea CBS 473.64]